MAMPSVRLTSCLLPCLLCLSLLGVSTTATCQQSPYKDSTAVLLSRLDLAKPGLEKVKALSDAPEAAAVALLAYYRARTSVRHPVDRSLKKSSIGNYATATNLEVADNAMRHIFVGQSSYPPYAYGDDIDWLARPVPDIEWVAQLSRIAFWVDMGKAYWHTGDEKYAREWAYQLGDWVKKNPRDISTKKDNGYPWTGINSGSRAHRLTHLFQYFIDSPAFTPELLVTFLNNCYQHAINLMGIYTERSNWALMEAEGMAFIAVLFPEFMDAEAWKTEAIGRLNKEMDSQVYPDGHQCELAMGYHVGCIGWFSNTLDLAKMNGMEDAFPDSYRAKIEKMCEVPMKLGLPDGANTQFGDSWKGQPGANWGNLKRWATRYNRPDFLYVATEGREGEKPEETAFAYKESGLYSMRSGWDRDDICLVLKCGDGGRYSHIQPDNGTFELYAGGRHLMPDAGSYIYSGDPENRAWFRQTKVHQTLTLDGANTAYAPKHLFWQTADDLDVLVVENAGYPGLTHRRAVFFVDKSYFVIVDEAYGNARGDVDVHFQFAPGDAKFDFNKLTAQTDFKDGWNVRVQYVSPENAKLEEEEGQVSYVYGKKEPRPAFRYRVQKKTEEAAIRAITLVVPYSGTPPDIQVELQGNPAVGGNEVALKVTANGKSRQIGYRTNF